MVAVLSNRPVTLGGDAHVDVLGRVALKPVPTLAVGEDCRPRFIRVALAFNLGPQLEAGVGDGSTVAAGADGASQDVPAADRGTLGGIWHVGWADAIIKRGGAGRDRRERWGRG